MRVLEHKVFHRNSLAPYCPDDERPVQQTGQDSALYVSDAAGKPIPHGPLLKSALHLPLSFEAEQLIERQRRRNIHYRWI